MKTVLGIAAMMLTTALAIAASQEEMMAEMEKCAVCKHLAAKPELMKDMTWETHKIDNGMIVVSTAPKDKIDEFKALGKKMEAAAEEVKAADQQGNPVELCDMCASWGELMKAGAKEKQIELTNGSVHLITSDDPAVVAKIHAEADKAIAMQKDWDAAEKAQL